MFYNSVWVYNIYTHKQYPVNPIWLLKIEQEQNKKKLYYHLTLKHVHVPSFEGLLAYLIYIQLQHNNFI